MTLRIHDISKSFGQQKVLDRISRSFAPGLYALQGPNGIGKSTLLTILAGIQAPDAGTVTIDGYDLQMSPLDAKARLAFVPDDCPVYPFLRGRDFLDFVASAKRVKIDHRIDSLVQRFGLPAHLGNRFANMSLGTQKKLLLVAAWIGDPGVILMDEPSNGLDPVARGVLIDELDALRPSTVVIMSTHDADFTRAVNAEIIPFSSLQS